MMAQLEGYHVGESRESSMPPSPRMVDSRFSCNICLDAVVDPVVTQCGHLYCWPCLYRWLQPGMYPEECAALGSGFHTGAVDSARRVCPVCKANCSVPTLVPIYVRSNEPVPMRRQDRVLTPTTKNEESDALEEELDAPLTTSTATDADSAEPFDIHDSLNLSSASSMTGIRQRFPVQRQENGVVVPSEVPARPSRTSPRPSPPASTSSPSTPPHEQQRQYRSSNPVWITPLSPTGHRASLSHGLLLSLQQAGLGPATHSVIPPIHRQDGRGGNAASMNEHGTSELEAHPGATEYLSRLLIMLGSFVLLCLLLL